MIKTYATKLALGLIGRSKLAWAAKPFLGGSGAVLMFHHCGPRAPQYFGGNDHLTISPQFLQRLLEEFRTECIDIVSLDEAIGRMANGNSQKPYVALTFDDGYRDNIETAYPILQHFRVPFTVFVCSGFVDRQAPIWWLSTERIIQANDSVTFEVDGKLRTLNAGNKWQKRVAFRTVVEEIKSLPHDASMRKFEDFAERHNHDPRALVDHEMSTWDMLRKLNSDPLVTIGAHTISHPFLSKLSREDALHEIKCGAERIEHMLGSKPEYFAYPYGFAGTMGEREVDLVKEAGLKAAFTTRKGLLQPEHIASQQALPRVSINGNYQDIHAVRALLSGVPFFMANRFQRVQTV